MKGEKTLIAGSLNALLVLEAAVRKGGFTLAARELHLSQPAVSRHIATLEGRLGCSLFQRDHNNITPTEAGQRLADAVALGFSHIDAVWREITLKADENSVVLACSYGFADQWLMSRFSDLRAAMQGVQVRVVTSDRLEDIDFRRVDAAVVWDPTQIPSRPAVPLIRDETFPVCSPAFLERYRGRHEDGRRVDPDQVNFSKLAPNNFLHFSVGDSGFQTWHSWFTTAGLPIPDFGQPAAYSAYPFLMRAVLNGEGIALGWRGLVDDLLESGQIVRAGPSVSNRATSYYLQHRAIAEPEVPLRLLVDWFKSEASKSEGSQRDF